MIFWVLKPIFYVDDASDNVGFDVIGMQRVAKFFLENSENFHLSNLMLNRNALLG